MLLRTMRENNNIVVEISDDGTGIPQNIQSRIFEQFFTTKGVGKGNGLGEY
jgi:signal transduction histidine kinase